MKLSDIAYNSFLARNNNMTLKFPQNGLFEVIHNNLIPPKINFYHSRICRVFVVVVVCFLALKTALGWGCSSVGRASDRHVADAGSIPRCGKRIFSQSQTFSADCFKVSVHPRAQSRAFTSLRTLKIP